jgi:hypothetical protein
MHQIFLILNLLQCNLSSGPRHGEAFMWWGSDPQYGKALMNRGMGLTQNF